MYTACVCVEDAKKMFDEMLVRSVYPWNALLRGNVILGGRKYHVLGTFSDMRVSGVELNVYSFSCLIKSFAGASALFQGLKTHGILIKNAFLGSDIIKTSLIDMYFKCGKIRLAHLMFEEVEERDVVMWGAMIAGFAHNRLQREALEYTRSMIKEGLEVNSVILTTMLPVIGEVWARKLGQEVHAYVIKTKEYSKQLFIQSALVDMYSKCGDIVSGRKVFYGSKERNAISWTALISGYILWNMLMVSTKVLLKFMEHANDTNDIFLLAAKVISFTILRHRKLKESRHEGKGKQVISESRDFSLLLEAWKPVSMGYKKRWWDCIALPGDVDGSDEASFRMQIKELAFTSLQLLKAAIFDEECKPLLSLEMYGHIIGMFELNNLDLVVESPVEDYFLYIDDLPLPGKEEAEQTTKPILDALGDDYSICCQGTAFFPLQSCMNHSCRPNAKAFKREEDRDGQAAIIALQPIAKGEEITISYIDEDLPFEERRALLADYGFRCRCPKCLEEA